MWSRVILCLFVGLAYATHSPAWKTDKEYLYAIHGRTLALLSETSREYSGILFNATLRIQPTSDGELWCEIRKPVYSQIQSKLSHWDAPIPRDSVTWKPLGLSSRPFQVEMKNGIITDILVNRDIPNWEANMIKSIVSQFQLNTKGENVIENPINILPREGEISATYKTMEDTVTGHTETLYSINELPAYIMHANPKWSKHMRHYNNEQPIIEIVKNKNYTNFIELPTYIRGLGNMHPSAAKQNGLGEFMSRECLASALVTGDLNEFTVHVSTTTEIVATKPLLSGKEKTSVISYMHVHLSELNEQNEKIEKESNLVRLGNLVYSFERSTSDYRVTEKKPSPEQWNDDEFQEQRRVYQLEPSPLDQAPQTPLLPLHTGYKGISIKNKVNIVEKVIKRCKQIAEDVREPLKTISNSALDKFTYLVNLVRLLSPEEIKQVVSEVYTTKQEGYEHAIWVAFRDAIAEAGTGPALLTIQDWIVSEKINADDASELFSSMTRQVRQPTLEFMKNTFDFIKSREVQTNWPLNETAILAYSTLIRKVYIVSEWSSNVQYAGQSFGSFRTEEGRKFAKEIVIPYFTQQLQKAIAEADSKQTHTYIRALGNIGHPFILHAFKPFLEGHKQCSQFQRMLMVIAMDKLAATYPEVARSILYKIYRNIGESQEIRVAAVHQLMRTNVPVDMLQTMAMYTHVDQHQHVNAAVKLLIHNVAKLNIAYPELSRAAQAALPYLNEKSYGSQYGSKNIRQFFYTQLSTVGLSYTEYITTEKDRLPTETAFSLHSGSNGIFRRVLSVQALISSFEQLMDVFNQQSQWYQEQQQSQQQQRSGRQESVWSSHNLAKLMKMTGEEREELEGYLYMQLDESLRSLSFNNRSIEQLPKVIRHIEQQLKNGHRFNGLRMKNSEDVRVSFPTAMGLPFLYSYNHPTVFRTNGHIKASAQPQISDGEKLWKPENVKVKVDTTFTMTGSHQGRISFTTPFDHQQYICGFERNYQVHIPLRADLDVDVDTMKMRLQVQPKELEDQTRLFHYSTYPFTSRVNVLNTLPMEKEPNTRVWSSENMRNLDRVFGEEQTGIAMRVQIQRDRKFWDMGRISHIWWHQGPLDGLVSLYRDQYMEQSQVNVYLVPEKSSNNKVVLQLGATRKYWENNDQEEQSDNLLQRVMRYSAKDIKTGRLQAFDASIEFQGSKTTNYSVISSYAKSWEHPPKSSWVLHFNKESKNGDKSPFEFTFKSNNQIEDATLVEANQALDANPKIKSQIEISFGEDKDDLYKYEGEVEFSRSDDRKAYIKKQPVWEQCKREIEEGNTQLPACMVVMTQASMLDKVDFKLNVEKLSPQSAYMLRKAQATIAGALYPKLSVKYVSGSPEWNMKARFDPDLRSVNISARAVEEEYTIKNVFVEEYVRDLAVLNTMISGFTRLEGSTLKIDTFRPMCVVDKTKTSTFNNRTFPTELSEDWTVMFQYVPYHARHGERKQPVYQQLKSQIRNFAILVRENKNSGRDVKIVLSSPETDYQVVDITVMPTQKVIANGKEIMQNEQAKNLYGEYILLKKQPTGEMLISIRHKLFVIYDGQRVRIGIRDDAFRNSVRGICGQLNGEPMKDLVTPQNCIARDEKKFTKSYEISQEGDGLRQHLQEHKSECVSQNEIIYADIISYPETQGDDMGKCTRFQTLYVEHGSETCFTTRPMPVCHSRCQGKGKFSKNVPVHCIPNSSVAKLWKTQIDKGASPDFSHKPTTKNVPMQLPQKCVE